MGTAVSVGTEASTGSAATIGRRVRVTADDERTIEGVAVDIDENGHLCVETERGVETIASGTCTHLV